MKENSVMTIVYILALIIIPLAVMVQPYFEAKSFNQCTGGNASYITALTTELRITECKR